MRLRTLLGTIGFVVLASWLAAGPRDQQWKQVDDAVQKGLPRTALERLEPILHAALQEKAHAEATRAIARKIVLESSLNEAPDEQRIERLQAEMASVPAPMKPLMQAVLAHWYWQYFEQNRWRFLQRTETAAPPGSDLRTWDLSRILNAIDEHFTAALANEAELQAMPVATLDGLVMRGTVPDTYRPTVYDFLAHQALSFYQAAEQGRHVAEDEFQLSVDSPIFDNADAFARWAPATTDTTSPKLKAVRLYQGLLAFHRNERDRSAYFDVDLARLAFGNNAAVGENKSARYRAALERYIDETSAHEIFARACAALAEQRLQEDDPAGAHVQASRGAKAFPNSAGGALCANLISQIEAPALHVETERVWAPPAATLKLTYRNVRNVHFRAVPVDFVAFATRNAGAWGWISPEVVREQLSRNPALTWQADLPDTQDFKQRTEPLAAPTALKPGFYLIIASADANFADRDNYLAATTVWVSELALVVRNQPGAGIASGLVVHANSGDPIPNARVRFWQQDGNRMKPSGETRTDADGRFEFPGAIDATNRRQGAVLVLVERDGQAISAGNPVYSFRTDGERERRGERMVFFTDRALYRPGQSVYFKGIRVAFDHSAGTYTTVAGQDVTVVFTDPNGEEIERAELRTNDYGSVSGVFTAPRNRLTGAMTIQVLGEPSSTQISVEEYKRPKFQVELEPPIHPASVAGPVELTGKATAYTGAAIGGAKVTWRVQRQVRLPLWCWWWPPIPVKSVAHGTATTEPDGSFTIAFTAEPDRSVPADKEPIFSFVIHADVTDTTGETRSDERTVRIGYAALQATISAGPWLTTEQPITLDVSVATLNGEPQAVSGTVAIHHVRQPDRVQRADLDAQRPWWRDDQAANPVSETDRWEAGERVTEARFATDTKGTQQLNFSLPAGLYRAVLETRDANGRKVTGQRTFQVLDPSASKLGVKLPDVLTARSWSVEPAETFRALWGTGYERGRAYVELERDGKKLRRYWTPADRTQTLIEETVTEDMRGGITLRVTYVRENRAYVHEEVVDVPWSHKELDVRWETFRSKLEPGQKETWTAVITGPDGEKAAAEMVAALYDASLDQFRPHGWPAEFGVFRREASHMQSQFQNTMVGLNPLAHWIHRQDRPVEWRYRQFPPELGIADSNEIVTLHPFAVSAEAGGYARVQRRMAPAGGAEPLAAASVDLPQMLDYAPEDLRVKASADGVLGNFAGITGTATDPRLQQVSARQNLNETAFFFPSLVSDGNGTVKLSFTMPEALTEWKFLGFAHDAQLRSGTLKDTVVTAKDLMVEPNPPRFLREGDVVEFTVKVSNQSDQPQRGTVRLTFTDALSEASVDAALGHTNTDQPFDIPPKQSRSIGWRIAVPDGLGVLSFKAVAATEKLSDGEQGVLPVLSRRVLVRESLSLPIRGRTTKVFDFEKLLRSSESNTLQHQSLTVQMVSQPAWYAVLALPYLMEFPHECSEQLMNRIYANALARHIANSDPRIRRVFEQWKGTDALQSPLEKNQDLKSVVLEETPWVRDAADESQARRNVGVLFDANRLNDEVQRAVAKLGDQQLEDGLWPWFPGGRSSEFISLYIMTSVGRLRHLGVKDIAVPVVNALGGIDRWMAEHHRRILTADHPNDYVPSSLDAFYLYGRSFFLEDQPLADAARTAADFFLRQARKHWPRIGSRQSQAHLALALQRFGDKETPAAILRSLKERSTTTDEMGMFWPDTRASWWWYEAPIETQAVMIEVFAEVARDTAAVENCRVWLMKQKQTQDWRTTKATADAVYALLLRGSTLLGSDALVQVSLGGERIAPTKVEAGTGFYEERFSRGEIKPEMGRITVSKSDDGVSWGSVHWQYLEDIGKVTSHSDTPLSVTKTLWVKETTKKGPVLKPVKGAVAVGDELVVRVEIRTDRDMEFVHLKDYRGSGTEPVNVLSQYKYQDGLGYYESTRDTASHFFIEYLRRGTYVFEYSVRVQLKGEYQTGMAEIQCMYAPEFNSHSESVKLVVE